MHTVWHLALADLRLIRRDIVLMMTCLGPILFALALRIGLPYAEQFVQMMGWGFSVLDHVPFLTAMVILFTPMTIGMMIGLIILDDIDDGLFSYMAVTPLARSGYLLYRLLSPVIISLVMTVLIVHLLVPISVAFVPSLLVITMTVLSAPFVALIMGTMASNKVEGLAIGKAATIMMLAPIVGYFIASDWGYLLGIVPPYWVMPAFIAVTEAEASSGGYIAIGFVAHAVYIGWTVRLFLHKKVRAS